MNSHANLPPAPELPTTLFDSILAVVPKLSSTSFTSLRHFSNLIQVLPRPSSQSSFSSTLITLAKLNPRAVYAAFDRLAIQLDRDTANPDALAHTICHLAPALRMKSPVILTFDLASEKPSSNKRVPRPSDYATLASALVLSLYAHGKEQVVDRLITQRWMDKSMWAEPLLHHLILRDDGAGLEWWDTLGYPVPASIPWRVYMTAICDSHIKALEWMIEKSNLLGKSLFPDFTNSALVETGVYNGSPQFMDRIWNMFGADFYDKHWVLASTSSEVGGGANVAILEWARGRGIPLPEPEGIGECVDRALSVQVLDWWSQHLLLTVDVDELGYTTDSLDSATVEGSIEKLDWWLNSGLELRFSPRAIESAKGKPELEEWWENCLQFKLLSGAISVDEAAAAGIAPCRHFETLCAWGRMDLMDVAGIDSQFEQQSIPGPVLAVGVVAACRFGHVDILERFRQVIETQVPSEVDYWPEDWVDAAVTSCQFGALEWLCRNRYTEVNDTCSWDPAAASAILHNGDGLLDVLEWMYKHGYLSLPASEELVSDAVRARSQVYFPALHMLWKLGGGLGVYSFGVTDGAIRMAIDANCQEMIQWWMEKQGDFLHPLHVELLRNAIEDEM